MNGPVYNLESMENLPEPIESHQHLEHIEGDESDPFAPRRYRLITTHILPPVVVTAPTSGPPPPVISRRQRVVREKKEPRHWPRNLGELTLDPLAPDGIAVKLLLLEAQAPFIIHEIDPLREVPKSVGNPQGRLPSWKDADGSCLWEAHAIMRYVHAKHGLDDEFYFGGEGPLKFRTDQALDWCREFLATHVRQVLDPESHEHEDLSDLPGGRTALDKDYKVLTDYFLRETPFIGGEEPNMADYSICMHLLMLYATSHPPPDRVRQYLHNTAEHVANWNDVTLPIREFCMLRQKELRVGEAVMERRIREEDRQQRREFARLQLQEAGERRVQEEQELRFQWEGEERRREEEDSHRREEQDRQMRSEWEAKRHALEERRRRMEAEVGSAESAIRELDDELRRLEEEEAKWREEYEERMRALRPQRPSAPMRPQLGLEIKMLDDSDGRKDCIVCVERVIPNGPAQKAGMQGEDIIDRWNGDRLWSKQQWADKVKGSKIGERVTLTVYRGTEPHDVVVTIGGTSKEKGGIRKVASRTQVSHNIRYEKPPTFATTPSPVRSPARKPTARTTAPGSREIPTSALLPGPAARRPSGARRGSSVNYDNMPREISMASTMSRSASIAYDPFDSRSAGASFHSGALGTHQSNSFVNTSYRSDGMGTTLLAEQSLPAASYDDSDDIHMM